MKDLEFPYIYVVVQFNKFKDNSKSKGIKFKTRPIINNVKFFNLYALNTIFSEAVDSIEHIYKELKRLEITNYEDDCQYSYVLKLKFNANTFQNFLLNESYYEGNMLFDFYEFEEDISNQIFENIVFL